MKIFSISLCLILALAPNAHGMFKGKNINVIKLSVFKRLTQQSFNTYKKLYSKKKSDNDSKKCSLQNSAQNALSNQLAELFNGLQSPHTITTTYLNLAGLLKENYEQAFTNKQKILNTTLFEAIENNDINTITTCILGGADVNALSESKSFLLSRTTPLTWAIRKGTLESIRLLLNSGADVNLCNQWGTTPLMEAIKCYASQDIIKLFIDNNANVNAQNRDRNTALIFAIIRDDIDIIKLLIAAKADVNIHGKDGHTALIKATEFGNKEIAQDLINAAADVNLQNKYGFTALMCACFREDIPIAKILLNAGAKKDIADKSKKYAADYGLREFLTFTRTGENSDNTSSSH